MKGKDIEVCYGDQSVLVDDDGLCGHIVKDISDHVVEANMGSLFLPFIVQRLVATGTGLLSRHCGTA